jgi:hypothetical protein
MMFIVRPRKVTAIGWNTFFQNGIRNLKLSIRMRKVLRMITNS